MAKDKGDNLMALTPEMRSEYVEQIAKVLRQTNSEIEKDSDQIIIVQMWSELAELDEILGMSVYVMNIPAEVEWSIAVRIENSFRYLTAVRDAQEI